MGVLDFLFGKKGEDPRDRTPGGLADIGRVAKRGAAGYGIMQDLLAQQLQQTDTAESKALSLLGDQARQARAGAQATYGQALGQIDQGVVSQGIAGTSAAVQQRLGAAGQMTRELGAIEAGIGGQRENIAQAYAGQRRASQGAQMGLFGDKRAFDERIAMEKYHLQATSSPMGVQAAYYGGSKGNIGGVAKLMSMFG